MRLTTSCEHKVDGDVLNIISIKDAKMAESYDKVFSPRYMMINKDNGAFNRGARLN